MADTISTTKCELKSFSLKLMDLRCLRNRFQILICIGLRSPSHQHTNNSRIIPNHRKKIEQESLIRQNGKDPYQEFYHSLEVFKGTARIYKKKVSGSKWSRKKKQLRQSQTDSDGHKSQKHKCTVS